MYGAVTASKLARQEHSCKQGELIIMMAALLIASIKGIGLQDIIQHITDEDQ
jgi:hypothetical protein